MRTIKEYKPCEQCEGRGLEQDNEGYTIDCRICDGYGENLITVRKEIEDGEKPE